MNTGNVTTFNPADKLALKRFISLERKLMKDYPYLISEIDDDVAKFLTRKNLMAKEMDFGLFVVSKSGQDVGRCAAIINITFILLLALASACTQTGRGPQSASSYLILAEDPEAGKTYYLDGAGKMAIPPGKYAMCLTDTFRTHAVVLLQGDYKWAVIDRQEQVLYEIFPYDNGPDYPSEGLFRIVQNGKIGYADAATYAIIIEPRFDCAFPFENGRAKVSNQCQTTTDGKYSVWTSEEWQYVDKQGGVLPSMKVSE
jgi:hypothetical protein